MNIADIIFFLVLILGSVIGYYAGALRLVLEILRWGVMFLFGTWWYNLIQTGNLFPGNPDQQPRLLIFLTGMMIFIILLSLLLRLVINTTDKNTNKMGFNKISGLVLGLVTGILIGLFILQGFRYSGDKYYATLDRQSKVEGLFRNSGFPYDGNINTIRQDILSSAPVKQLTTIPNGKPGVNAANVFASRPDLEYKMLLLVNDERRKVGLLPLKADEAMRKVGRAHAIDMLTRNYFSHSTPEGEDPFQRMTAAGIRYHFAGENLAAAATLELAHTGLMHSPSHRAAILNEDFKRVGIAVIDGGPKGLMIAQEFRD